VRDDAGPRGRAPWSDETGSSLVEFALIASVLFVLLFGIVEFGLAFRDRLGIGNATQSAGRVGSQIAGNADSDWEILQQIEDGTQGVLDFDDIVRVDIYSADAAGNVIGGKINSYLPDPLDMACPWTQCPDPDNFSGYGTAGWIPDDRDDVLPDLELIGVRVYYEHVWLTGLFPLPDITCTTSNVSACWEDAAVFRIEPQDFEP
jgi:hypothetical protein